MTSTTTSRVFARGALSAIALALIGVAVITFVGRRAWHVPLTYDEAATHTRYIAAEPTAVFDFSVATNHFLNTVTTRLSAAVAGDDPWALRLPNVMAAMGYVVAAAVLARRLLGPVLAVPAFVLLVANLYLFDYFSASRGYGLAVALFMGALACLERWLSDWPHIDRHKPAAAGMLALASLAVAASFSVLSGFIALACVVVVATALALWRRAPQASGAHGRLWPRPWHAALWLLVAAGFTLLVLSREFVLSENLFSPITVRIVGLFEDELDDIRVYRVDRFGRLRDLVSAPGVRWQTDDRHHARSLGIEMPLRAGRNLTRIDVTIDGQSFSRTLTDPGPWDADDVGGIRTLRSTTALTVERSRNPALRDAINWGGDAAHRVLLGQYVAVFLAGLVGLGVLTWLAAWIAVRFRLLDNDVARYLAVASMWTAVVCAAPVYLLRRNVQLYFGGEDGVVADTLGSLIRNSFHGALYHPRQVEWVLMGIGVLALVLPVWLLVRRNALHDARARFALALLVLVALVLGQLVVQHWLLDTRYLTGRTALWLLAPTLLYVVSVAAVVAQSVSLRRWAGGGLWTLAALVAWHAWSGAQVKSMLDFPHDASTPAMLETVAHLTAESHSPTQVVRVGVEWIFYAGARYYAERPRSDGLQYVIEVLPTQHPPAYSYTTLGWSEAPPGEMMQVFPDAQAVLRRHAD